MKVILKEDILKLRKEGLSYSGIKKKLGCTLSVISYHCRREESSDPNINRKPTEEEIGDFNILYEKGYTYKEIGEKCGYERHTISKYVSVKRKKISKSDSVINWRKTKKEQLVDYKGGKCEKCGYNNCIQALQFHHLDPLEKDFTISGKSWSFDRLKKEVDKCVLLCANCHIETHYL